MKIVVVKSEFEVYDKDEKIGRIRFYKNGLFWEEPHRQDGLWISWSDFSKITKRRTRKK